MNLYDLCQKQTKRPPRIRILKKKCIPIKYFKEAQVEASAASKLDI